METDIQQQRIKRSKRRERAQRMHAKKHELDSGEEDEISAKEKAPRPPPPNRRKKKEIALFDEDVVDGFAILSFKSYDDLEVSVAWPEFILFCIILDLHTGIGIVKHHASSTSLKLHLTML